MYISSIRQELQRRLDQTLGKPGSYYAGIDRVGNVKPMTVGARLYRVEQHLANLDKKVDQIILAVNTLTRIISTISQAQALNIPTGPSQTPSPTPARFPEDDA